MVTVSQALHLVANSAPEQRAPIVEPVYRLIAESLFRIANSPDPEKRGSLRKATQAQKMILDRMVGVRMPGSNPAAQHEIALQFVDLTVPELGGSSGDSDREPEVPETGTSKA